MSLYLLEEVLEEFRASEKPPESERDIDLFYARLWQGLQNSFASGRAMGKGKWADVASGQTRKSRFILNNRRMSFGSSPRSSLVGPERLLDGAAGLVRSKPTAYGRATLTGSAVPACLSG